MRPAGLRGPNKGGYCRAVSVVAFVQCLLVCVVAGGRLSWRPGHQIILGRCFSYCINTHLLAPGTGHDESSEEATPTMPRHPVRTCSRHRVCKWCLHVCKRLEDDVTNSESCLRDCRRFTGTQPRSAARQACTDACGFVGRASSAKGGTCPLPSSLKGFQSSCVTTCRGDSNCPQVEEKCCSNDCGSVCTVPRDVHILPPIPRDISFKMLPTGSVRIKWDTGRDKSATNPDPREAVIYILRWWCPYKKETISSVTDRARSRLAGYPSGIYPGSTCRFMVAAVNEHGSRGFSKVSPYIKQILIPSPPRNLDTTRTTLHDGKIDVTIQWQPPAYTDGLPVHRYEVILTDSIPQASPIYRRLYMRRWPLKPDKTSFVLHNLEPGGSYFLQVRAVVRWKERQKKGQPASTYIELLSYAPAQQANVNGMTGTAPGVDSNTDSIIESVRVNNSFFHDNILKADITWQLKPNKSARKFLIFWRLETCAANQHRKTHNRLEISATSHERSFTLYNLQPDCEYAVRVNPVSVRGRTGAATVTNFLTPPCQQVPVLKGTPPTCNTADPPGRVQGLHSETSQCVTLVRWEPPPTPQGAEVQNYHVTWGESKAGTFSPSVVIYSSVPSHLSVPANTTQVELGRLHDRQHYTVQVNATSPGGSSPPAILHLTVPQPIGPCRGPGTGAVRAQAATSTPSTSSTPLPDSLDPDDVRLNANGTHGARGDVTHGVKGCCNNTDNGGDVTRGVKDCCNNTDIGGDVTRGVKGCCNNIDIGGDVTRGVKGCCNNTDNGGDGGEDDVPSPAPGSRDPTSPASRGGDVGGGSGGRGGGWSRDGGSVTHLETAGPADVTTSGHPPATVGNGVTETSAGSGASPAVSKLGSAVTLMVTCVLVYV